jgi:hypothetical protein
MNSNELAKTLIEELFKLKYEFQSSYSGNSELPVISREHRESVSNCINSTVANVYNYELGLLQAKVYAYEQIIANSNFKAVLVKEKDRKETTE